MTFKNLTHLEIIHRLEAKFDFLTNIAYLKMEEDKIVFHCLDIDTPSILTVDAEGWVLSRPETSRFGDVLGSL